MVNDILYHSKVLSICINKTFRFRSPLNFVNFASSTDFLLFTICNVFLLQYVRIADNTTPEAIWDLTKKVWALKPPTLSLSIVGGNRKTQLDVNIKHSLEGGLGKVCSRRLMILLH